jgi:hypothetical protein
MRHESIDTIMQFYVGRDAESAADALWSAFEAAKVLTRESRPIALLDAQKKPQTLTR